MKYFLEFVVSALVENREDVFIDQVEEARATVFYIRIHPSDVGRVIGKSGKTIGAIRTILNAARDDGKRVQVEIVENV
ncbi:MAG: KH domain-containing protein [Verrucomicrobiota bacterium]